MGEWSDDDTRCCCVYSVVLGSLGTFVFIICFALSFDIVALGEMAICEGLYQPRIYSCSSYSNPGYHFVGLDRRLIMFPSTKILVEFASGASNDTSADTAFPTLAAWTSEGANVYIDISFYYQLKKSSIEKFYKTIGSKWKDHIVRLSYAAIKEATVAYTTTQFYSDRIAIGTAIKSNLNLQLFQQSEGAVEVTDLQLRKISFDTNYEAAINKKLIQAHLKKSYENQQKIQQTNKNTDYIINGLQNTIDIALNDAYSVGNNTLLTQRGTSLQGLISSFNTQYGTMMSTLGITNQEIQSYIYSIEQILSSRSKLTLSTVDNNARSRAITADLQ